MEYTNIPRGDQVPLESERQIHKFQKKKIETILKLWYFGFLGG